MPKEELVYPLCPFTPLWIKSGHTHQQSSELHLLGRGWFHLDLNGQMASTPILSLYFWLVPLKLSVRPPFNRGEKTGE